ncbi:hypothetical protein ABPG72_006864 [Tetrahymena utriculariae]
MIEESLLDEIFIQVALPNKIDNEKGQSYNLLLVPKLEKDIQQQIWRIKKEKSNNIFLGIMIIVFTQIIDYETLSPISNNNQIIVLIFTLQIIAQLIFAYMVDLLSFNASLLFSNGIYLLSIILNINIC